MTDKKKHTTAKQTPEHVIRCGHVKASVYLRRSTCGYPYYDFGLSRTWKSMATGNQSHGTTFFDNNEDDLIEAVQNASAWIRQKMAAAHADLPAADEAGALYTPRKHWVTQPSRAFT